MSESGHSILERFITICHTKKVGKPFLLAIPNFGAALAEFVYGDQESEISKNIKISIEQNKELLEKVIEIIDSFNHSRGNIIAIGSGNGDTYMRHDHPVLMGSKNFVTTTQYVGGSGVNYTLRLISSGFDVIPILSIGNDFLGELVKRELLEHARKYDVSKDVIEFIESKDFFEPNIKTPNSSIIHDGTRRTIFAETLKGADFYHNFLKNRLSIVERCFHTAAMVIGHVHSDGKWNDNGEERIKGKWGKSTKYLVDQYSGKIPVILNFGNKQLELGVEFWRDTLEKVSVVQLNIAEARNLFAGLKERSLRNIFSWFRDNSINVVVTVGQMGAVASYGDGSDGIIHAIPIIKPQMIVDTTGAGDAFSSGMVSHFCGNREISFSEFRQAVVEGRKWASYACTTFGASAECPTLHQLEQFMDGDKVKKNRTVKVLELHEARGIIDMIDAAYPSPVDWHDYSV